MNVQRLVSFKLQRPQITVVTSHPCYDTVTLNPNNQTELHGIAVALLCVELTVGRDAYTNNANCTRLAPTSKKVAPTPTGYNVPAAAEQQVETGASRFSDLASETGVLGKH